MRNIFVRNRLLHPAPKHGSGRIPPLDKRGFTLLEIVIIVVVVAILLSVAIVSYIRVISKSEDTEAVNNLEAIRASETAQHAKAGTFVNATNTQEINEKLSGIEIQDKTFRYKVINATLNDFVALAERVKPDTAGEKPIVISMYADGTVAYTYSGIGYGGDGSGSSGGGASGGGGGGGGAGGSGGGLGSGGSGSGGSGSSSSGGSSGDEGDSSSNVFTGGAEGTVFGFTQIPVATGNDGFVSLGWTGVGIMPDYFNIYRATSENGDYSLLESEWYASADYYTDLFAENDTNYYYRIDAVYADQGAYSSTVVSAMPSATSTYALAAQTALEELTAARAGEEIADILDLYNVTIGFGTCNNQALAWYEPLFNTIRIDLDQFEKTKEVHTALLAHEGTHAWWANDITQGQPERGLNLGDSIDQEYHAFSNSAAVWNEIKRGQTDLDQDSWADVIALGEADAKEVIRLYYPGLPDY